MGTTTTLNSSAYQPSQHPAASNFPLPTYRPTHRPPGDTMDALVARYSRPSHQESTSEDQQQALAEYAPSLSLNFALPPVASSASWLRAMTDDRSNPQCPIKIAHGTTTLAFRFQGGISVAAASKILANLVYSYKGMGLSMGTMCAGMTKEEGPALYYIDSDGTRLAGNLFCVGSGQTFAYGVLDAEYNYEMKEDEALELGRRSILAATHRDAFSGGYINLYHVKEDGWEKHGFNDTNPIFWETKLKKGEFSNVTSELV